MGQILEQLGIREPSPVVPVRYKIFEQAGLKVFLKRESELHPVFGGNKWRKLKYNLYHYLGGDYNDILSFGGMFSNHIFSLSALCRQMNIPLTGIIRDTRKGEELGPTLEFARDNGMRIRWASREAYRDKDSFAEKFASKRTMVIPEGGTNKMAIQGAGEIVNELSDQFEEFPSLVVCPAGTGGTAAGMLALMPPSSNLLVFSALKGDWMKTEILKWNPGNTNSNLEVVSDQAFGGYGKWDQRLITFLKEWYDETGIALDPIYNAKAVFGLVEKAKRGEIAPGSTVVIIHTGGGQGTIAFNQQYELDLPVGSTRFDGSHPDI